MHWLALLLAVSQRGERPPLQPYDVRSASGEWTLEVRPTDPQGKGSMRARILHAGAPRWSGELPWTFAAAGISDDGTCVGYANGKTLRIAVLDARGVSRAEHEVERTVPVMHGETRPFASGPVLVHPSADLALIRVHPTDQPPITPWRSFRLSSGEAAGDIVPEQPLRLAEDQGIYEGDARAIGDTGLILLHWRFADFEPADLDWTQDGAVFSLHDLAGKAVWTLALLDDYTDRSSEEAQNRLEGEARRLGAIVSAGPGERFVLRHFRERALVEYGVRCESDGRWSVAELSRVPWVAAEAAGEAARVEPIELVRTGSASLRTSATPVHAVHDVLELGFTELGELELLRGPPADASYARLRANGELVFERDLAPALAETKMTRAFHELAGDRWLVQDLGAEPPWITFDVRTGATAPAPLPDGSLGCHIAPLADGGYLALVKQVVQSLALTELYHVRSDGTVAWKETVTGIGPDETPLERAVYFGSGLARTGETTFTLLSMRELTTFDLERTVLGTWDLEAALGHRPSYMNGLLSDARGGVLFEEGDAFHRIDARGTRVGSFLPRRADGSRDTIMDHFLRVAPDGRMWTSDRQRVYRLDEGGVADLVLGPEVGEDDLVEGDSGVLDALGRALVQDRSSRAVHVFDADGKRLAICRLPPAERPDRSSAFGGEPDGTVWVRARAGVARFDPTGAALPGAEAPPPVDKMEALKTRPDGTWLSSVVDRAFLPGGRRAILEKSPETGVAAALHLYTPDGEPLRTIALPGEGAHRRMSTSPRWLVVGDYGPTWTLVRLEDERVFRFDSGLDSKSVWRAGQTPDGESLLLLDARRLELVRYDLP